VVICLWQGANDLHMVQATAILSSLACFITIPDWCNLSGVILHRKEAVK